MGRVISVVHVRGRQAAFASLGFLLLALISVDRASADVAGYRAPAFCSPSKPVRDFGFSALPPVQEVPESAESLGHNAVSISGSWSRIMSEPSSFGYSFSEQTYTDEGVRLDWKVTAQLWAVNRQGTALQ